MTTVFNKLEKVFLGMTGTTAGVIASGCYLTSSAAAVAAATSIKLMIQNWEPLTKDLTKGKPSLIEKDINIWSNPFVPGRTSGPWQTGLSIGAFVAGIVFTRLAWSAFSAINNQNPSPPMPKKVVPLTVNEEESPTQVKETTRGFGRHR